MKITKESYRFSWHIKFKKELKKVRAKKLFIHTSMETQNQLGNQREFTFDFGY